MAPFGAALLLLLLWAPLVLAPAARRLQGAQMVGGAPPKEVEMVRLSLRLLARGDGSKFLFPEGSGAGISTPSASADPLLAGAGTAASAVVGCSRERARAASSALADIAAGSRCYPRDVFAAARPLLLARKEERCVGARSRSTSVHSNNSLCSEIGRLANPPS